MMRHPVCEATRLMVDNPLPANLASSPASLMMPASLLLSVMGWSVKGTTVALSKAGCARRISIVAVKGSFRRRECICVGPLGEISTTVILSASARTGLLFLRQSKAEPVEIPETVSCIPICRWSKPHPADEAQPVTRSAPGPIFTVGRGYRHARFRRALWADANDIAEW